MQDHAWRRSRLRRRRLRRGAPDHQVCPHVAQKTSRRSAIEQADNPAPQLCREPQGAEAYRRSVRLDEDRRRPATNKAARPRDGRMVFCLHGHRLQSGQAAQAVGEDVMISPSWRLAVMQRSRSGFHQALLRRDPPPICLWKSYCARQTGGRAGLLHQPLNVRFAVSSARDGPSKPRRVHLAKRARSIPRRGLPQPGSAVEGDGA